MATIRVNLTKIGNACEQDETPAAVWPAPGWYAFLLNCDGTPFIHAKKQYGFIPMDHGYCEIKDVPPGRYLLFAIVNPFRIGTTPIQGGEIIWQANFASHTAVVIVCCGCQDYCVTLWNSSWHYCVQVIQYVMMILAEGKLTDTEAAKAVVAAIDKVVATAKYSIPRGDKAIISQLEEIVKKSSNADQKKAK